MDWIPSRAPNGSTDLGLYLTFLGKLIGSLFDVDDHTRGALDSIKLIAEMSSAVGRPDLIREASARLYRLGIATAIEQTLASADSMFQSKIGLPCLHGN